MHDTDVFIAGAGPVGLTAAMDLQQRGVRVTLAEPRRFAEPPNVKCNHVSARSMETFRRLGVAAQVRGAGLPDDYPNDVSFRTSLTGHELSRIHIPCRRDRYTDTSGPDGWWPTPEPPHRINQTFMEPILLRHAAALPGVTLHNRTQLTACTQDADGVTVQLLDLDSNQPRTLRARYLIGCDGGSSTVRKQIGAQLEGTSVIQRVQSSYIRAPGLRALMPQHERAWSHYSYNPRRCGAVFTIDGDETWLVHNHLNADEPEFDSVDRDWAIRQILGVDDDFRYEIVTKEDWIARRLVANRFRNGRVFIAGDAAHLWVPYAGYGMNAGIADAANLSWLLAACVQGWADERMLDAYEAERQPITLQVSHFAMDHAAKMIKARSAVPANIEALDEDGAAARAFRRRGLRAQRAAVLLRRAQLRLLLRRFADHRGRRRNAPAVHDGQLHRIHRAGLPPAARVAGRRALAVRRARPRLHAAATRPARRRVGTGAGGARATHSARCARRAAARRLARGLPPCLAAGARRHPRGLARRCAAGALRRAGEPLARRARLNLNRRAAGRCATGNAAAARRRAWRTTRW
jgi:2-polyprenyl-6-methoxyphenol hydroxylase-like FAD-dependent oxidoreductase